MTLDPLHATRVHGTGRHKLIALHGWLGASDLFTPLHGLLDEGWSACFPDCRGYGDRKSVSGALTVEEIASDALSLADHLGWSRFHVLGHSMAGLAAQRLMVDVPGRLQSALLLAPVPAAGARLDEVRRRLLLAALSDPAARLELIDINTGSVRDLAWLERLRDLSVAGTVPDVMGRYLSSWTGPGFAEVLRGNACPTTVIIGRRDPGTPEGEVRQTFGDLLVNVRFEIMEDVGHYAMREAPEALAGAIRRHVVAWDLQPDA